MGEGGLDPQYFLHTLTLAEAMDYIKGQDRRHRNGWEQARLVASTFCKVMTGDDPQITFSWDTDSSAGKTHRDPEEEAKEEEWLKQYAQHLNEQLKKKQDGKSNTLADTIRE